MSAISGSSGSGSGSGSASSTGSSNIERSGAAPWASSKAPREVISGIAKLISGPAETSSLVSDDALEGSPSPMMSEKSSGALSFTFVSTGFSTGSGMPMTKSSASLTSFTLFGIGTVTGFSPLDARNAGSLPRERISALNFLS